MSFNKDENSDPISENMEEHEDKVNIEETSFNLGCVKKELDEEELVFEKNQYNIALNIKTIFRERSIERRNNRDGLIGFSDGEVIMETGSVKLEDVKEENKDLIRKAIEQSYCSKCSGTYQGYCLNCSSLSHILNNLTPNLNPEQVLNTIPMNMLEIREVSGKRSVFALKTFPQGVIIGPFEGIAPIESTTGLQWKIKDKKFVSDQNANWMKYIESAANHASKNLHVFHFDGILYFETSREIQEGEELLVCYDVEEVLESDKEEEFYLVPVKKEEYPKVFACTRCCLGFGLEKCLMEHKSKCPQRDHGASSEDFEIIQCCWCKVWLEKREHLEGHRMYCLENYNRLCHNIPNFQRKPTDVFDKTQGNCEISTPIDENIIYAPLQEVMYSKYSDGIFEAYKKEYFSEKKHKCSECSYQTNRKTSLKLHLNTHNDIKPFECDICKTGFNRKSSLKVHIINQHSNTNEKEYKCSKCCYQTNRKDCLRTHLNTHDDIKLLECDICKKRFTQKTHLKLHMKNQHSSTEEKQYKCSECSYQTNNKGSLKIHLNSHADIKPFECGICKNKFTQRSSLNDHIRNQHSDTNEKKYKCSECSYQTTFVGNLNKHLNTHNDMKPFECDICKKRFTLKRTLKEHIRIQHSIRTEKEYKCPECSYQTNDNRNLKRHLNRHNDINPFECDICKKRFNLKPSLKMHMQNKHSITTEKEHKCSECLYQTNLKGNLKLHLNTHNDIKPFECDICKKRFTLKCSLKFHTANHHSNTSEKEYKCSECSYQTNLRGNLKLHLDTHSNIKPFECDICKKSFNRKSHLKTHITGIHLNTSESLLDVHNAIKLSECDICKKRFTLKGSLKKHIQNNHSNTSEKKYKCSACFYQTNLKSSLNQHHSTHRDIKPFECDFCKKGFTQKAHLKLHVKKNAHLNTVGLSNTCRWEENLRLN